MSVTPSYRVLQKRVRAALVVVAVAVALLAAAGDPAAAGARAAAAAQSAPTKPTIVLVHGAFTDASGFGAEIAGLQADGYPVVAPAVPLRGLTSDSDYIRSVLATIEGPVVLVGHSYGGAVITNAARGASNVVALVYLAAFVPAQGESVATSYDPQAYPGSLLDQAALTIRPVTNPSAPGGQDADLYIRSDLFHDIFAGDQSPATAAVMAAAQRPLSAYAYTEASGTPAWKTVPSWDLVTLEDRAIPAAAQRFMAERAGAHIRTVHSAHDVMISHPQAVLDLVENVAAHVS